jgi:hypothetical protein
MADFPLLKPATRTFMPGSYHQSGYQALSGKQSRVSHSNATSRSQLRLTFQGLSQSERFAVESHYYGQQGRFIPFELPAAIFNGTTDLTPASSWRYVGPPEVEEIPGPYFNITVPLESVLDYG